jgi:hypothetical protein
MILFGSVSIEKPVDIDRFARAEREQPDARALPAAELQAKDSARVRVVTAVEAV